MATGATDVAIETKAIRDRAMLVYLALGLAILAPGVVAAFGLWPDKAGTVGSLLAALEIEMRPIAFGHGIRFWLGVAGASMMALLLLYPLRKLFGFVGWMSVASWFHVHLVFGLLGPIMILYHAWFGSGSTPANVALATTLVVALSGLFGHYVYTRLSADYHTERRRSQELLEVALAELGRLPASPTRNKLAEDLKTYESEMLAPEAGASVRLGLSRHLRSQRRDLLSRAVWIIDNQGPPAGWTLTDCREAKRRVYQSLTGFLDGVGRSARRSINERLAGVWRLMHMPLFFITVVAASIHVYKVWDMDSPPAVVGQADGGALQSGGTPSGGDGGGSDNEERAASEVAGAAAATDATAERQAEPLASPASLPMRRADTVIAPRKVTIQPVPVEPVRAEPKPDEIAEMLDRPPLVQEPKLVTRSPARGAEAVRAPREGPREPAASAADQPRTAAAQPSAAAASPAPAPRAQVASQKPIASSAPRTPTVEAPPKALVAPSPAAAVVSPASPPPTVARVAQPAERPAGVGGPKPQADPVAELGKRVAQWDNTGKLDPRTVRERLAELKKDRSFDHDKTNFPLTGKHKRVACESCHKTTLKDTSRRCIDCHRKDDVHRGRRPNCESCHVTTNWGTIRRR
ncbi:MAG: hypothetical protein SFW09_21400 [Hyphomicrobiaceae bacterium]|nr:hypothetical protein [Hyphomicrobiaceae bacterium]